MDRLVYPLVLTLICISGTDSGQRQPDSSRRRRRRRRIQTPRSLSWPVGRLSPRATSRRQYRCHATRLYTQCQDQPQTEEGDHERQDRTLQKEI